MSLGLAGVAHAQEVATTGVVLSASGAQPAATAAVNAAGLSGGASASPAAPSLSATASAEAPVARATGSVSAADADASVHASASAAVPAVDARSVSVDAEAGSTVEATASVGSIGVEARVDSDSRRIVVRTTAGNADSRRGVASARPPAGEMSGSGPGRSATTRTASAPKARAPQPRSETRAPLRATVRKREDGSARTSDAAAFARTPAVELAALRALPDLWQVRGPAARLSNVSAPTVGAVATPSPSDVLGGLAPSAASAGGGGLSALELAGLAGALIVALSALSRRIRLLPAPFRPLLLLSTLERPG